MIIIFYLVVLAFVVFGISVILYAFKPILTIAGLKTLTIIGFFKILVLLFLALLLFYAAYRVFIMKEAFFIC